MTYRENKGPHCSAERHSQLDQGIRGVVARYLLIVPVRSGRCGATVVETLSQVEADFLAGFGFFDRFNAFGER